jgi:hypothetical protein
MLSSSEDTGRRRNTIIRTRKPIKREDLRDLEEIRDRFQNCSWKLSLFYSARCCQVPIEEVSSQIRGRDRCYTF